MKKLTEKDAIWCKTQKQWNKILVLFPNVDLGQAMFKNADQHGYFLIPMERQGKGTGDIKYAMQGNYTIHKAKDILKKSKIDKLRDYVDDIEVSYGKRLNKIEKHLFENTTVSKMESVEALKFDLPTKELEELPEKWCVVLTEENRDTLTVWLGFSKIESPNGSYVGFDKHVISLIAEPWYTEITFDQFKKWVLKEEGKPLSIREVQVKVSNQEEANECAEIARACGEHIWDYVTSIKYSKDSEYFLKNNVDDDFLLGDKDASLKEISLQEFRERFGKKQETEIDWSKAGQLVENEFGAVRITNGKYSKYNFFGTLLTSKAITDNVGKIVNSGGYPKKEWKLCTEPITLKND